jgi:hypothetical protein
MPFKTGDSIPPILRATIARVAKERGLSLSDAELQVIERFLNALNQCETAQEKAIEIRAKDAEFLKSLGIRQ